MTPFLRAAALVTVLALTACSGGTEEDAAPSGTTEHAASSEAFPVTVETAFGDVVVEAEPQRVVAMGWGDAETALALGVQPVGASDWLAFGGEGVGPWAEGLYESPPEIIGTLEPDFEQVVALEPDLILDVKSSGDPERYDVLSQIAPVVAIPEGGESYLTTAEQQLAMIAAALGRVEEGEALQAEVDDAFETAAADHPQWDGMTASAVARSGDGWGAYVEGSGRVVSLERLGFVQDPDVAALPTSGSGFSVDVSAEELSLVDADLVVAFPVQVEPEEITGDPLWQRLPAVADGRAIVLDGDLQAAYALGSTLSIGYALDELVPLVEAATT